MTRDETVALFLQGREAWNAWAEEMLAKRKALEEAGKWKAARDDNGDCWEPENEKTRAWVDAAQADFSNCLFLVRGVEGTKETVGEQQEQDDASGPPVKSFALDADEIGFSGFEFPADALFENSTFSGGARFLSATFSGIASFESATFSGDAFFVSATFLSDARFKSATFSGGAKFLSATFSGIALFESATFSGDASFVSATFSGDAWFKSAIFSGGALFARATFLGLPNFERAIFSGDTKFTRATFSGHACSFVRATFSGIAWFDGAIFEKSTHFSEVEFMNASFSGIKVERAFDMTGVLFGEVPAFNQADFKQAPDLDDVRFPQQGFWRRGNEKLIPKYRALRRMAIQGADYEREQMAFKGELRARRWTVDKPWHLGLWLGMIYDGVADCGRSIVRPMNVWAASIVAFAAIYLWAGAGLGACAAGEGNAAVKALYLSGRNALVLFSGSRDSRLGQAYQCLYGGTAGEPAIPDAVSFIESFVQLPVSALLIFLVLLAVRNRYKIK